MTHNIHAIAVDNLGDCTSTTYCGLVFSIFQDISSNDNPTCKECRKEMISDRVKTGKVGKRDPEWLKFAVSAALKTKSRKDD